MKDQPLSSCTFSNLTPKNRRFHRKGSLKNIGKRFYRGQWKQRCVAYRERFGIPKLRSAVKSIIYNCNLCKTYCKGPLKPSVTVNFLIFPSELDVLSQAIRIDFTVPLIYKQWDQEIKGYIVILTCATLRAVHLKCSNQC